MENQLEILPLPISNCPACGYSMSNVWVFGQGNNGYGRNCYTCNRVYIITFNPETRGFRFRPVSLK